MNLYAHDNLFPLLARAPGKIPLAEEWAAKG
jgi:hypothetical protein